MSKQEKGPPYEFTQLQPWAKIQEQIGFLDKALTTIPHYGPEETKDVRQYIIGQIEALKWAVKLWDG